MSDLDQVVDVDNPSEHSDDMAPESCDEMKPTRSKKFILILSIALAFSLVAVAGGCAWMWRHHWRKVQLTVNGQTVTQRVDTTAVAMLEANGNFNAHPGNYVDVEGVTLREGEGEPIAVTVNGDVLSQDQKKTMRIPEGAQVSVESGRDIVEDHEVTTEPIAHGAQITFGGAIQMRSSLGKDGVKEFWAGKQSAKRVEHGVTEEASDLVVVPLSPKPEGKKVIAMTFDDGPSQFTPTYLDILKARGIKATFFMVGQNVKASPEIAQRVVAEGHQIAGHTYNHPDLSNTKVEDARQNIADGFAAIKEVTGRDVDTLRAPYGAFYEQQWKDLGDLISKNVLWDIDTLDWKRPGAAAIKNAVLSNAHNGAIVLMHDGGGERSQDIEALPGILDELKAQGYEFVTVDELIEMSK